MFCKHKSKGRKHVEAIFEGLAQYGPLGLWTASLLWMNWQQRKDQKEEEKIVKKRSARKKIQDLKNNIRKFMRKIRKRKNKSRSPS